MGENLGIQRGGLFVKGKESPPDNQLRDLPTMISP
jgi:hypothetical protein